MKIAVCVKRVPSTEARIKPAADGRSVDPAGVDFVVNPYDEYAIEAALQLKEKAGEGEVVVFTVGPEAAQSEMRKALAMGADRGVLVKDEAPFRDGASTGKGLAAAIAGFGADLVLFGKQAVDDDGYHVPAVTCHALGIPLVQVVTKIEIADGKLSAERPIEGGVEAIETLLPAGVSCQKGLNEPRYASLPNIMKAKKKPIEVKEIPLDAPHLEPIKIEPPPPRPEGRIVGEGTAAVPELVRLLREEAKVL